MSTKEKTMSHIIKSFVICASFIAIAACSEQSQLSGTNTDQMNDGTVDITTANSLDIEMALNSGGGQISSTSKPARNNDADGDGLPDAIDPDPEHEILFADSIGDNAFVLNSVHSLDDGSDLNATLLQDAMLKISVTGSEFYQGAAWVVFETATGYRAESPEVTGLSQWEIRVPEQYGEVFGLHLVKGNYRTNSLKTVFLLSTMPRLYPYNAQVEPGETVVLQGRNLLKADQVILARQELAVLEKTENTIKVTMPTSSVGNTITVVSNGKNSNGQPLDFISMVEISIDTTLLDGLNTYRTYYDNRIIELADSEKIILAVPAYRPLVMNFDVISNNGVLQSTVFSTLIFPGQLQLKLSAENNLLAELYKLSAYTAFDPVDNWADAWNQLLVTVALDEAQTYIDAFQAELVNHTDFDQQAQLKAVLQQINPLLFTVQQPRSDNIVYAARFTDTISGDLDEVIPQVVSHRSIAGRSTFAGFNVDNHSSCDFTVESVTAPANLWPSDLCVKNGSQVYASLDVYNPENGDSNKYVKTDRVSHPHISNWLDPGILGGSWGILSLFPSVAYLSDKDGGALCKMRTCFVEIITGGLTTYQGEYPYDQPLSTAEKKVANLLKARTIMDQFAIPIISGIMGLDSDSSETKCIKNEFLNDASLYYPTTADFAAKMYIAAGLTDAIAAFNDTYGKYIIDKLLSDSPDIATCLGQAIGGDAIEQKINSKLKKVAGKVGVYYDVAKIVKTAYDGFLTFITPEKIIYQILPRAEIMQLNPAEIDLNDAFGTVFIHGNQLAIGAGTIGETERYPKLEVKDKYSAKIEIQLNASHLKADYPSDYYTNNRFEVSVTELLSAPNTLASLASGPIRFTVKLDHRDFVGYPDGDLPVPANRLVNLIGASKIRGFSPAVAIPGQVVSVTGDRFSLFEKDYLVMLEDVNAEIYEVQDLNFVSDNKITFSVPDGLAKGAYTIIVYSEDHGSLLSDEQLAVENIIIPSVTIVDSGPDYDDTMILSFIDSNGVTVMNNGSLMEYSIPSDTTDEYRATAIWKNSQVAGFTVFCDNTGVNNETCTYNLQFTDAEVCKVTTINEPDSSCIDSPSFIKGGQLELYDQVTYGLRP